MLFEHYASAERLEHALGSPLDPLTLLSFAQAVELDERDAYPEAACAALDAWGLADYYIPRDAGGKLDSFEEALALWRVLARRNLSVAVAHVKTFLGAIPVWVGGSAAQKQRMAQLIKAGRQVALAYHEHAHGSDLNATAFVAQPVESGYTLAGEKWLINNATRSAAVTLFARTSAGGGPRGFSLFLLDKQHVAAGSYSHLAQVKTHGVRGADFSGIRVDNCYVPDSAVIGQPGAGMELSLRAFQLTRTLLPGLALGAADTALRATLDFALNRQLYGDAVFAIPHARGTLVNAFLDLLICECVAISTARAVHTAPGRLRQWSAVAKYFVPTTIEQTVRDLAVVLGARHYLREGHWSGIFQKMLRDVDVVSVFHAGTYLNLITIQLQYLADQRAPAGNSPADAIDGRLAALFDLDRALPAFDPQRLELIDRGGDDVIAGVAAALAQFEAMRAEPASDHALLDTLALLGRRLCDANASQRDFLHDIKARHGRAFSHAPELFDLAQRQSAIHVAACCMHMWRFNRQHLSDFFRRGEWLALSLQRLLAPFGPGVAVSPAYSERTAQELARLHHENMQFSIIPLQLP